MKPMLALAVLLLLPAHAARADGFCARLRDAWSASQTHDGRAIAGGLGPGWSCFSPDPNGLACTIEGIGPAEARARYATVSVEVAACMGALGLKRVDALSSEDEIYLKRGPSQPMVGVWLVSAGLLSVMVIPED